MVRRLSMPTIRESDYALPIENGGTSAMKAATAAINLGLITNSMKGIPNGAIGLDADGKIDASMLPSIATGNHVNIFGDFYINIDQVVVFNIEDYDSFKIYNPTVSAGTISQNGSVLTYVAPSTEQALVTMTVAGRVFTFAVEDTQFGRPVVTAPIDAATNISSSVTITSSAFSYGAAGVTHVSTDWQVATDANFATIVKQSIADATNKTSWTVTGLTKSTSYFIRVRYNSSANNTSKWSAISSFTTKATFSISAELTKLSPLAKAAADSFGHSVSVNGLGSKMIFGAPFADTGLAVNTGSAIIYKNLNGTLTEEARINATNIAASMTVNIPSTGSMRVQTNSASLPDTTYTTTQTITIPADASIITLTGKGGTGTSTYNAGQPYIAPSPGTLTWAGIGNSELASRTSTPLYEVRNGAPYPTYSPSYDGQLASTGSWSAYDSSPAPSFPEGSYVNYSTTRWTATTVGQTAGQPYIAPYYTYTTGPGTSATYAGQTYTFAGGYGGAATASTQILYLNANDQFGTAVSISKDGLYVAVGAPSDKVGTLTDAGTVCISFFNGTSWQPPVILKATDATANAKFGSAVQISADGTEVVIGAPGADGVGAAYTFLRVGTVWTQEAKLVASDKVAGDLFGSSVGINSDSSRVVIGSPNADPVSTANAGAAYVFLRTGTTWAQEAKLVASNRTANDVFGTSLAIDATGSAVIAGAPGQDPSATTDAGAAYVFRRTGTTWTQESILVAADKASGNNFGNSVTISDNGATAAVGAKLAGSGAAYVFLYANSTWTQAAKLTASDATANDQFGFSVHMSGNATMLAVGAPLKDLSSLADTGAVYLYT